MYPISEANSIATGCSTQIDDEHEQNEADDCRQLDRPKNKFGLSVEVDR